MLGFELPVRIRREIDPLQDELWAGDEQGSDMAQAPRNGLAFRWPRVRHRHGLVHMKLPLSPIVEKAERRVASLLDFRNHEPRAYGVDRTGGNENDIVLRNAAPLNQVQNRAIFDRGSQLCRCEPPLQSQSNFGVVAERMYQASVLPRSNPIDCAKASSG